MELVRTDPICRQLMSVPGIGARGRRHPVASTPGLHGILPRIRVSITCLSAAPFFLALSIPRAMRISSIDRLHAIKTVLFA